MSSPYPVLQTMPLPEPAVWEKEPPASLRTALETRFKPLQTTYPGMIRFARSKQYSSFLRFDHRWHLDEIYGCVPQRSGAFSGRVQSFSSGQPKDTMDISGYCKITHLLDAYQMIQGHYPMAQHPALPAPGPKSAKLFSKLHDPHNQAYVDAVACYMLSKFRESGYSPHFSLFYGAYLAIANQYYYNVTEEFSEIRFENWFWKRQQQGIFSLAGFEGGVALSSDDPLMEPPNDLSDDTTVDSDCDSDCNSARHRMDVDLDNAAVLQDKQNGSESGSLRSISLSTHSSRSGDNDSSDGNDSSGDNDSSDGNDSTNKEVSFFAVLKEFPTMMMFLESNTNTMDSLLDTEDRINEDQWIAWLFQVVAALCQVQSIWAMTHNDLHSNNILWTPCTEEYLYYKTRDGRTWRIPTYGKLFRIIDFGRAIYTHNDTICISDDYAHNNEAGGQYNFGPIYNAEEPRVYPNPSFDLCRLSVSILESLFEEVPEDKEDGVILSAEPGRIQKETVSPLFNVLWSWLIDEEGKNVLWESDSSERYPGFDLYQVIAKKVKNAVPREQLDKEPFSKFEFKEILPPSVQVYPLFC
jgi:hypothetical protein